MSIDNYWLGFLIVIGIFLFLLMCYHGLIYLIRRENKLLNPPTRIEPNVVEGFKEMREKQRKQDEP